jgi:hypothetical protein
MSEITPLATAGVAGFFHTPILDKTMIDCISMPHLIFENFPYPLWGKMGKFSFL